MAAYAIHISDLHVGAHIDGGGILPFAPGGIVPRATGHDVRALEALDNFLITFHRQHPLDEKLLVVSGDVSSNGAAAELALYKTLLRLGFVRDNWLIFRPLSRDFRAVVELPGNHDFWEGFLVPNPMLNATLRTNLFDPLPARQALAFGRHRVVFHALCSTSGCTWQEQLLAFGAFLPSDVDATRESIEEYNRTLVGGTEAHHMVVLHHSPMDRSRHSHRLTDGARQQLDALCHRRVTGLLTGHRHRWRLDRQNTPKEVRCGTTLQAPLPTTNQERSLVVHEFDEVAGKFTWCMTPWTYDWSQFDPGKKIRVI